MIEIFGQKTGLFLAYSKLLRLDSFLYKALPLQQLLLQEPSLCLLVRDRHGSLHIGCLTMEALNMLTLNSSCKKQ